MIHTYIYIYTYACKCIYIYVHVCVCADLCIWCCIGYNFILPMMIRLGYDLLTWTTVVIDRWSQHTVVARRSASPFELMPYMLPSNIIRWLWAVVTHIGRILQASSHCVDPPLDLRGESIDPILKRGFRVGLFWYWAEGIRNYCYYLLIHGNNTRNHCY